MYISEIAPSFDKEYGAESHIYVHSLGYKKYLASILYNML